MVTLTFEKIIIYISSIGTFISALAALYAIWLAIFQRRLSYKPAIVINDLNIKMETEGFYEFDLDIMKNESSPSAKFSNIGLGSAISIRYHWKFNYKKNIDFYLSLFNKKFQKIDESFTTDYQYGMFKIRRGNTINHYNMESTPRDINFSLPYSIEKESKDINIPTPAIIIMLNIAYLAYQFHLASNVKLTGPELVIEYQDIEGKTQIKVWQTILEYRSITFSKDDMKAEFSLRFTPKLQKWSSTGLERMRKTISHIKSIFKR